MIRTTIVELSILVVVGCGRDAARIPSDVSVPVRAPPGDDTVDVPAGWFRMGCVPIIGNRSLPCAFQEPPRDVWLSHFAIDRLETSRGQYWACVDAGACERPLPITGSTESVDDRSEALPAEVTSEQAFNFCRWRQARLPTDAEWQKAARGPTLRAFPWGSAPPRCDEIAMDWDAELSLWDPTAPHCMDVPSSVGTHPKDRGYYGALDMAGNVPEWTSNWDTCNPGRDVEGENGGSTWVYSLVDPQVIGPRGLSREQALAACTAFGFEWFRGFGALHKGGRELHGIGAIAKAFENGAIAGGDRYHPDIVPVAGIRCARSLPGPAPPEPPAEAVQNRYRATFRWVEDRDQVEIELEPSFFTPEE